MHSGKPSSRYINDRNIMKTQKINPVSSPTLTGLKKSDYRKHGKKSDFLSSAKANPALTQFGRALKGLDSAFCNLHSALKGPALIQFDHVRNNCVPAVHSPMPPLRTS